MNEIFIIFGTTGEYSNRHSWPVRAFATQVDADLFAIECQKEADPIWNAGGSNDWSKYTKAREYLYENNCKCDQNLNFDYTGTDYYVSGPLPFGQQD
jgi:hypothetical protein